MKKGNNLLKFIVVLSIIINLVSCNMGLNGSSPSPGTPSQPWGDEEVKYINNLLNSAGRSTPLAGERDDIKRTESVGGDGNIYAYETHDVVDNITSITHLGLNDDVIWPGSIIRGDKIQQFVYNPISVERAPITISSSLGSSQVWEIVQDPSLSTMRQAICDLIDRSTAEGSLAPANVEYNINQVYNESDLAIKVGASLGYGGGEIKGFFNWNSVSKKNKIIASYRQVYYTIDVDTPGKPSDFFSMENSVADLENALAPDSMPLYVSSISYGYMAFICIETDFTLEQMKTAMEASYDDGTVDVELDFGFTTREVLESSNVNVVVYGGSTNELDSIESGLEGFSRIISASRNFSGETPGVPLIYRFRHVVDNRLAEVTLTSQYTLTRMTRKVNQVISITCNRFVVVRADDEGPINDIELSKLEAKVSAWNCMKPNVKGSQACNPYTPIYNYSSGGDGWVTGSGGTRNVGSTINIALNTDQYDFNNAIIELYGYARENDDWPSDDETGSNIIRLTGFNMLGEHKINITSADFSIDCYIT
ncbi:MAG: hypothetical protein GY757_60160, partial [bacterium]|nr:hypothetical protein [bacterium]